MVTSISGFGAMSAYFSLPSAQPGLLAAPKEERPAPITVHFVRPVSDGVVFDARGLRRKCDPDQTYLRLFGMTTAFTADMPSVQASPHLLVFDELRANYNALFGPRVTKTLPCIEGRLQTAIYKGVVFAPRDPDTTALVCSCQHLDFTTSAGFCKGCFDVWRVVPSEGQVEYHLTEAGPAHASETLIQRSSSALATSFDHSTFPTPPLLVEGEHPCLTPFGLWLDGREVVTPGMYTLVKDRREFVLRRLSTPFVNKPKAEVVQPQVGLGPVSWWKQVLMEIQDVFGMGPRLPPARPTDASVAATITDLVVKYQISPRQLASFIVAIHQACDAVEGKEDTKLSPALVALLAEPVEPQVLNANVTASLFDAEAMQVLGSSFAGLGTRFDKFFGGLQRVAAFIGCLAVLWAMRSLAPKVAAIGVIGLSGVLLCSVDRELGFAFTTVCCSAAAGYTLAEWMTPAKVVECVAQIGLSGESAAPVRERAVREFRKTETFKQMDNVSTVARFVNSLEVLHRHLVSALRYFGIGPKDTLYETVSTLLRDFQEFERQHTEGKAFTCHSDATTLNSIETTLLDLRDRTNALMRMKLPVELSRMIGLVHSGVNARLELFRREFRSAAYRAAPFVVQFLGSPGSGKTSIMRWVTTMLLQADGVVGGEKRIYYYGTEEFWDGCAGCEAVVADEYDALKEAPGKRSLYDAFYTLASNAPFSPPMSETWNKGAVYLAPRALILGSNHVGPDTSTTRLRNTNAFYRRIHAAVAVRVKADRCNPRPEARTKWAEWGVGAQKQFNVRRGLNFDPDALELCFVGGRDNFATATSIQEAYNSGEWLSVHDFGARLRDMFLAHRQDEVAKVQDFDHSLAAGEDLLDIVKPGPALVEAQVKNGEAVGGFDDDFVETPLPSGATDDANAVGLGDESAGEDDDDDAIGEVPRTQSPVPPNVAPHVPMWEDGGNVYPPLYAGGKYDSRRSTAGPVHPMVVYIRDFDWRGPALFLVVPAKATCPDKGVVTGLGRPMPRYNQLIIQRAPNTPYLWCTWRNFQRGTPGVLYQPAPVSLAGYFSPLDIFYLWRNPSSQHIFLIVKGCRTARSMQEFLDHGDKFVDTAMYGIDMFQTELKRLAAEAEEQVQEAVVPGWFLTTLKRYKWQLSFAGAGLLAAVAAAVAHHWAQATGAEPVQEQSGAGRAQPKAHRKPTPRSRIHAVSRRGQPQLSEPGLAEYIPASEGDSSVTQVLTALAGNCVHLVCDDTTIRGFFVAGRYLLLPAHCVRLFSEKCSQGSAVELYMRDRKTAFDMSKAEVVFADNEDIALVQVDALPGEVKNILRHFVTDEEFESMEVSNHAVVSLTCTNTDGGVTNATQLLAATLEGSEITYTTAGERFAPRSTIKYDGVFESGQCGSMLLSRGRGVRGRLMGFHIAKGKAYYHGQVVTRETVDALIAAMPQAAVAQPQLLDLSQLEPPSRVGQFGRGLVIADFEEGHLVNRRSKLKRFRSRNLTTKRPSRLTGDPDPLAEAVESFAEFSTPPPSTPALQLAITWLVTTMLRWPHKHILRHRLTLSENVNGCRKEDVTYASLDLATSAGFPHYHPKKVYFSKGPDGWVPKTWILSRYHESMANLCTGQQELYVQTAALKDELLPPGKAARLFCGSETTAVLTGRALFLPLQEWVTASWTRLDNPIGVGFNHTDVAHLRSVVAKLGGPRVPQLAADFKRWDKRLPQWAQVAAFDVLARVMEAQGDFVHALAIRTWGASVVEAGLVLGHELTRHSAGLYSGIFGTSFIGSIVHWLLDVLWVIQVTHEVTGKWATTFVPCVRTINHSDDVVMSLTEDAPTWLTIESLVKFWHEVVGLQVTDASKKGELRFAALTDPEVTFLSRTFVWEEMWLMPLKDVALHGILSYHRAAYSERTCAAEALAIVYAEASLHPQERFPYWLSVLQEFAQFHKLTGAPVTEADLLMRRMQYLGLAIGGPRVAVEVEAQMGKQNQTREMPSNPLTNMISTVGKGVIGAAKVGSEVVGKALGGVVMGITQGMGLGMIGLCKPFQDANPSYLFPSANLPLAQTVNVHDGAMTLACDPSAMTTMVPEEMGDEVLAYSIPAIGRKEMLVSIIDWSASITHPADTVLLTLPVNPTQCWSEPGPLSFTDVYPTRASTVASCFSYWAGGVRFKVYVQRSLNVRGSLLLTFQPRGNTPWNAAFTGTEKQTLFNIQTADSVDFVCPHASPQPWLQVGPQNFDTTYRQRRDSGVFQIVVRNPLVLPSVGPTSVRVLVFMSLAEDTLFACPSLELFSWLRPVEAWPSEEKREDLSSVVDVAEEVTAQMDAGEAQQVDSDPSGLVSMVVPPTDEAPVEVSGTQQLVPTMDDPRRTIEAFVEPWVQVAQFTWDSSTIDSVVHTVELPDAWLNNPRVAAKLANFTFARFPFHVRVVINGQPFQGGMLGVAVAPMAEIVNAVENENVRSLTGFPGGFLFPHTSEPLEIHAASVLPNLVELTRGSIEDTQLTVVFYSLGKYTTNDASDDTEVTVFARPASLELAGPTRNTVATFSSRRRELLRTHPVSRRVIQRTSPGAQVVKPQMDEGDHETPPPVSVDILAQTIGDAPMNLKNLVMRQSITGIFEGLTWDFATAPVLAGRVAVAQMFLRPVGCWSIGTAGVFEPWHYAAVMSTVARFQKGSWITTLRMPASYDTAKMDVVFVVCNRFLPQEQAVSVTPGVFTTPKPLLGADAVLATTSAGAVYVDPQINRTVSIRQPFFSTKPLTVISPPRVNDTADYQYHPTATRPYVSVAAIITAKQDLNAVEPVGSMLQWGAAGDDFMQGYLVGPSRLRIQTSALSALRNRLNGPFDAAV